MEQKHFTHEEATAFFARLFGGEHHLPGNVKQCGHGFEMNSNRDMSTFDGSQLTSFVLQCHDECVRGSIENGGPGRIKLRIWKRQRREGSIFERHPTIEQVVAMRRKTHPLPESAQPSPWIAVTPTTMPTKADADENGRVLAGFYTTSGEWRWASERYDVLPSHYTHWTRFPKPLPAPSL